MYTLVVGAASITISYTNGRQQNLFNYKNTSLNLGNNYKIEHNHLRTKVTGLVGDFDGNAHKSVTDGQHQLTGTSGHRPNNLTQY